MNDPFNTQLEDFLEDWEDCTLLPEIISSSYSDPKIINSGSNGIVFVATDRLTKKEVSLKRISKSQPLRRIKGEISAGLQLRGIDGVPNFNSVIETEDEVWLIFDFVHGMDLLSFIQSSEYVPFQDPSERRIFKDIAEILLEVHSKGIAHKDLKCENIIIDPFGNPHLIDFGLSYNFECSKSKNNFCRDFGGSREYCAPEMLLSSRPFCATKADVWALGVTFYAMLCGCFPFSFNDEALIEMWQNGSHPCVRFPTSARIPTSAKDLLCKMLEVDPELRIDLSEILKHSFITGRRLKESKRMLTRTHSLPTVNNVQIQCKN
eukprot:TRINITY_DN1977_c0_g1_i1.p1 TRINITY_DN1977_c0_g1~~TRINITY_DN1977_c0_g1_i1.p1  ORF type:complete len:320 (-),score=37.36 TRINITY_DN1977_c0_g1_i1:95-1054(-)